ncbi:MAG: hypothetical protein RR877_00965 [Aurantimicrobium sp.]|uniref:hypothetical protein n=1 Tax=Aurantimicrobium sp. TaxID=1930784 RepID=UPI002FCC08FD
MARIIFLKKDVTGLLPDNFIQDENLVTVTGSNRLVIPEYGAFFEQDFELRDANTNDIIPKDDYYFSDLYQEASQEAGKAVWNIAIIKNPNVSTALKISYRAFGGPFSRNARLLVEWIKEREQDFINPATWDEVDDIPKKFAPSFHYHLLRDIFGGEYFEQGLKRIENSILAGNSEIIQSIIKEVIAKLDASRETALQLSKAIVEANTSKVLGEINKKYLGLDLVVNLDLATKTEMEKAADISVSQAMFNEDKYINKDRLRIFSDLVKDSIVSSKSTNLGLEKGVIGEPTKANIIATVNGATIVLDSMENNKANNVIYEQVVYPKNYPPSDQFTIVRIANNPKDKGGIWLGFNTAKLEAYIGIMNGDECFRRMRWYKFYTDGNLADIAQRVKDHISDTKNPHELTKEQIELGDVENYPVVTEAQILAQESVKSYMTMDTLQYFMAAHLLNLKANPNEDGEVDLKADLFDKANIIYTPCDKVPAPVCPPKGQLIKTYCDGSEKIGRWTDGACGFTDSVMESNSDDCDYFDQPKQGTEISTFCEGYNLMAKVSDGRGATFDSLKEEKSLKCGWNPPELGTLISTRCDGYNTISKYADGLNGNYEVTTSVNDPKCGYVPLSVEGTVITEFCNGPNRITRHADGKGGSFEVISAINDPECGYVAPTPPPPPPPTEAPPPGETPTPPPIDSGVSIFSNTSLANVGDKETINVKLINMRPYESYTVTLSSYATINRNGKQTLVSQQCVTDSNGNGQFSHEYSVTEDIFNIAGATSNMVQIVVNTTATAQLSVSVNGSSSSATSNEISKQVRRGGGTPPVTSAPPPPSSGNYNVFLALDPDNDRTQPTTVVPTSQQLTLTKIYDSNSYNVMGLTYFERMFVEKRIKSVTTGSAAGVYITHYLEILDDQGRIVLARDKIGRSVTSATGANWIKLYYVYVTTAMFAGLGNGMTYKARIKTVRESDNVESYSEMWPCVYKVQPTPEGGG